MKITLYYNESEKFAMNKTLNYIGDLTGSLKNATSLLNPNINVEIETNGNITYNIDLQYEDNDISYIDDAVEYDVSCMMDSSILKCNYCYIEEFERYYFIDNIIIQNNKLFVLILSVDSLESNKEDISNQNAFITRNEFDYNPLVKDEQISFYYDKEVSEYIPPKGNKVNTTFDTSINHTTNVVLSCISFNALPSAYEVNPPSGTNLPKINQLEYNEFFSETCFIMNSNEISIVAYRALKNSGWASYIKAITIYPFNLEKQSDNKVIVFLGNNAIKTLNQQEDEYLYAPYIKYKVSNYYIIADFTISGNSFLDYEPYTMYELYVPYYGWVKLTPDQILNHRIIVYYTIQVEDGSANAYVYDTTDNKLIFTSTCQLGVRIGVTTTNNEEISASKKANNLNLTLGLISSVASVGIGAYTGNATAVVGGVLSGAKAIGSYINNNSMMFDKAYATFGNGNSGMYSSQECVIRKTRLKPKNYNEDYFKLVGRPLNEYRNIGELKGYTVVGEIHLENIDATKQEIEQIESILKNGFIIE